jgi:predicted DNA-binding transcriptional regulator AlpA
MATKKRPEMIREPMWDVDDIAARLGLKPGSARNLIAMSPGFPRPDKVSGNARLWYMGAVEEWIAANRATPPK